MNYKSHYDKLIPKAQNRSILKSEYKEIHHIIPSCIGGSDDKDNLVALFAEEHWLAHLLLVKIFPTKYKLIYAVNCMSVRTNNTMIRNNKLYGWLKEKLRFERSKLWQNNNPSSLPHNRIISSNRMKLNNPMKNPETRTKMAKSLKGRTTWLSGLTKEDPRVASMYYERTDEIKEKNRQGRLGTIMADETKEKLSKIKKGKPLLKNAKTVRYFL